jgi:hypothetical protein
MTASRAREFEACSIAFSLSSDRLISLDRRKLRCISLWSSTCTPSDCRTPNKSIFNRRLQATSSLSALCQCPYRVHNTSTSTASSEPCRKSSREQRSPLRIKRPLPLRHKPSSGHSTVYVGSFCWSSIVGWTSYLDGSELPGSRATNLSDLTGNRL